MNLKIPTISGIAIFLIFSFVELQGQFRFDPGIDWKTLETSHCSIHYPAGNDSLAHMVVLKAEWYFQRLINIFHEAPNDKIQVVLDTSSDIVFGATTPFPNLAVYLNPTPASIGLGHYDDWLDLLISHEFTHAIDVDKTGGLAEGVRNIFGRLYFPGAYGPQWLIEGIATYLETELTGGGRGLDPYNDMILRMAFLEDAVNSPDQNCAFLDSWPGGNSSYIYGQSLYRYIAEYNGVNAPVKLRERYSSNMIPLRINEAVSAATSHGLDVVYENWQRKMHQRYKKQMETISEIGITPSRQLTEDGYENWSPQWSDDSQSIYYFSRNPDRHAAIYSVAIETNQHKRVKPVNLFETKLAYSSADQHEHLFFSKIELKRSYSLQNDIWMYDLKSKKLKEITRGKRARVPACHPDGEQIVYVSDHSGQTDLWLFNLHSGETKKLLAGGADRLFFRPSWSPDGARLALSVWERGGYRNIWILDLATNRFQPLLQDKAWDFSPCWTHDGRFVLFSSDRTGVFNLFAYDLDTHRLLQVTNVLGGAFDPAVSADDNRIAFANYSSNGFDIHIMDWVKEKAVNDHNVILGVDMPQNPYFVYGYQTDSVLSEKEPSLLFNQIEPNKKYNAIKTLLPRFYIPWLSADEDGLGFGIFTYGQDVLNKHAFLLIMQYGVQSQRPGFALNYVNNSFCPLISITASDQAVPRDQKVYYWDRRSEFGIDLSIPYAKIDVSHNLAFGFHFRRFAKAVSLAPGFENPYFSGYLNNFRAQYDISNAHRFQRSISPVEGMTFSLRYDQFTRQLNSDLDFYQLIANAQKYIEIPGLPRHVITVNGLAGRNNLNTSSIVENSPESVIRGFKSFSWKRSLYRGSMELRFPLSEIERSTPLLPIFLERFHAALFADAVQFRDINEDLRNLQSAGIELRLDVVFGYLLPSQLRLGVAVPIVEDWNPSLYFSLSTN